jgi:hypothetical protein
MDDETSMINSNTGHDDVKRIDRVSRMSWFDVCRLCESTKSNCSLVCFIIPIRITPLFHYSYPYLTGVISLSSFKPQHVNPESGSSSPSTHFHNNLCPTEVVRFLAPFKQPINAVAIFVYCGWNECASDAPLDTLN